MMCLRAIGTTGALYKAMNYADCDGIIDIDVNDLREDPSITEITNFCEKARKFLSRYHIAYHSIYIELWHRPVFEKYFSITDGVYNPILKETRPRRGFHFIEGEIHKIAMIYEDGWEKTLRHELTHVIQAETLGFELYEKIFKEIYLNKREIDPFELQAYYNEGN
jgi:hypothetical protein